MKQLTEDASGTMVEKAQASVKLPTENNSLWPTHSDMMCVPAHNCCRLIGLQHNLRIRAWLQPRTWGSDICAISACLLGGKLWTIHATDSAQNCSIWSNIAKVRSLLSNGRTKPNFG